MAQRHGWQLKASRPFAFHEWPGWSTILLEIILIGYEYRRHQANRSFPIDSACMYAFERVTATTEKSTPACTLFASGDKPAAAQPPVGAGDLTETDVSVASVHAPRKRSRQERARVQLDSAGSVIKVDHFSFSFMATNILA